jgi:hypothetical protein
MSALECLSLRQRADNVHRVLLERLVFAVINSML